MAIFPLYNKHATNYPAKVNENFTSGMALVIDSSGNAIKADRSNVSYNSIFEGYGKFIGFASGDHTNLSSVLMSDPVGSNYISSDNKFVDNVNSHYSASKRSISEFRDESVSGVLFSEYSKRGIGVFNLQGEIYITDQFARVESLFIDSDGTAQVNFNVGDLLTYGAGINAGKLVKVDTSAISPSVLIIGVVEKFDEASNLLYFRHVLESYNNTVSLFTTGITVHLDASNPTSYSGSGTTWYDLSGNGLNASLNNGTTWQNMSGGYFQLDGSDDNIAIPHNNLLNFPGDFTIEIIYNSQEPELQAIIGKRGGSLNNGDWNIASFYGASYANGARTVDWNNLAYSASVYLSGTIPVFLSKWYTITFSRISNVKTAYINGVFSASVIDSANFTNPYPIEMSRWAGNYTQASIASVKIWNNLGLTVDQIRQNYNSSMGRLI
jgi:hypothetical protein